MQFRKSILFLSLIGLMVWTSSTYALQSGGFTYTVSGGTVIITDYSGCPYPPAGNVVIPATINGMPVVEIGHEVFDNCIGLISVIIPETVTSIGNSAFNRCSGLTSMTIPDSVTLIGENAFCSCSSLRSVTIGNNVTRIGRAAFAECESLTSVTIPEGVTLIGEGAFMSCISLSSVTIPDSVTFIGKWAFSNCALSSVTIPASVTNIEQGAFMFNSYLTRAYFLGDAPSTGQDIFAYCASGFTVCYTAGSKGFTSPQWCVVNPIWCSQQGFFCSVDNNCYPARVCGASTTTTIPASPCAAEEIYGRDSEETDLLREYRDMVLSNSHEGQEFIKTYYKFSPIFTKLLEQRPLLKNRTKAFIDSMLPEIRKKVEQSQSKNQ